VNAAAGSDMFSGGTFSGGTFLAGTFFSGLAAVVAAGIALFALTRRPGGPLNRAAGALFGVLALAHLGNALLPAVGGAMLWLAAEACLPAAVLAFGLRMERAAGPTGGPGGLFRGLAWGAALFGLAVAAALAVGAALALPGFSPRPAPDGAIPLGDPGKAVAAVALMFHLAALVQLENVFRAAPRDLRYHIKYLVLGVAALGAMRIYLLSLAALYGLIDDAAGLHLAAATLVGGFMAAYALVRFRLLDVDVFISRYVIYGSIALVGTGVYLLAVGLLVLGLVRMEGAPAVRLVPVVLFVALVALLIALLSDQVRWKVRHFVDRNFYKNRHDYRVQWRTVSRAVAGQTTVEGLLDTLGRMARDTLGARFAVTFLKDEAGDRYAPCPPDPRFALGPVRSSDLVPDTDPAWSGGRDPVAVSRRAEPDDHDALYLPLRVEDAVIGLIALGPRISGVPYHQEDLELVSAMAAQTAVGVRNLQLGHDLAATRETAALHQLSTFFIHDMKNVTNSLGLLARNIRPHKADPAFWDDAETAISRAVDQMQHVMERLRTLRESPGGDAVAVDLGPLLSAWSEGWRTQVAVPVDLDAPGPLPCAADPDLLRSVFTNLVTNAAEAGATRVSVEARAEGAEVRASVADDGCGMDEGFVRERLYQPFATTKAAGMGIGMFQARRIVERFGGRIEVRSRPGAGTRFTVVLPRREGRGTGGTGGEGGAGEAAHTGASHG
jgi:signal transduction histidine kinase